MRYPTPLRYPGGKQKLGDLFSRVLSLNRLTGATYVEAFAGGAGVALYLLRNQIVDSIHLNDLDRSIYAFWFAVTQHNSKLCTMIDRTPITVEEWDRQKQVQREKNTAPLLDLGFSTLFLNRANRSGILRAGMIGGRRQAGRWKVDARFNKTSLVERVSTLRAFSASITTTCVDALSLLSATDWPPKVFFYLDPPYFTKSRDLYLNRYEARDHSALAEVVAGRLLRPWIVTYDDAAQLRKLYRGFRRRPYSLTYTADSRHQGREVMILSRGLRMPDLPIVATSRRRCPQPPPPLPAATVAAEVQDEFAASVECDHQGVFCPQSSTL